MQPWTRIIMKPLNDTMYVKERTKIKETTQDNTCKERVLISYRTCLYLVLTLCCALSPDNNSSTVPQNLQNNLLHTYLNHH